MTKRFSTMASRHRVKATFWGVNAVGVVALLVFAFRGSLGF